MSTVQQDALQPDQSQILAHLKRQTRRWHELGQPVLIEVRLFRAGGDEFPLVMRYSVDDFGLDQAASDIAHWNEKKRNAYTVRNPIRGDFAGKAATDKDIVAAFAAFADCDEEEAAVNLRSFVGPKYSYAVTTGTIPHPRPHPYWEFADPVTDLAAWTDLQKRIAARLRSDRTVVNPSRIMRVAGTVTWPDAKKRDRGYVQELVTIRTEYRDADERGPVRFEDMQRAFAGEPASATERPGGALSIDLGPEAMDRAKATQAALSGAEWHNNVVRLVASYVAKGLSDDEIHSLTDHLTLAGYTVEQTRREVQQAIDGARAKGWAPLTSNTSFDVTSPAPGETSAAPEPKITRPLKATPISMADLHQIPPRRWIYGHKFIRAYVSVVSSPPGIGKTALLTGMTMDMAAGRRTLHDAPKGRLRVWSYNLEDPREESLRRIAAAVKAKGYTAEDLEYIRVDSGRDRELIVAHEPMPRMIVASPDVQACIDECKAEGIDVLIVDPFVRAHRLEENDNKAIDFALNQFAEIADKADVAVILVHHSRKGHVGGDMDSVRGGSAIVGAARSVLTLTAMSPDEARELNITESERRFYVRLDNAKANLAPRPEVAEWYRLNGQWLANGTDEYPDGDNVQYVTPWTPPEAADGLSPAIATDILRQIDRGFADEDGNLVRYTDSTRGRTNERWAGNIIINVFRGTAHEKSAAQAKQILSEWIANGFLEVREYRDEARRKNIPGLFLTGLPGEVRND